MSKRVFYCPHCGTVLVRRYPVYYCSIHGPIIGVDDLDNYTDEELEEEAGGYR